MLTCSEIDVLVKLATLAMKATLLHQHLKSIVFLFFFFCFFQIGQILDSRQILLLFPPRYFGCKSYVVE